VLWLISANAMRASLLAVATATSLNGLVSSSFLAQLRKGSLWTCNGLVPVTCLSLCHLSFESQGAYAAQI
jgi:hypothetical protein